MLQAAAWIEHALADILVTCAPTPDLRIRRPSHTGARKYGCATTSPVRAALQATTPTPAHTPAVRHGAIAFCAARWLRAASHPVLRRSCPRPGARAGRAPGLRYVTPNLLPRRVPPASRRCGAPCRATTSSTARTVRLRTIPNSTCSAAMISVVRQASAVSQAVRCIAATVTETMAPVSMSTPCSALWAKSTRPTVLHLRDLRVRVLRRFPLRACSTSSCGTPLPGPNSNRARSGRVGVSHPGPPPPNSARTQVLAVGFAPCPTPLDAPHRRVRFQRRRIGCRPSCPAPAPRRPSRWPTPSRENRRVRSPWRRSSPPRARQRRVVRRRLGHVQVQKRSPHTQRIGHPPRDPPLGGQPFEIADEANRRKYRPGRRLWRRIRAA